MENKRTKKHLLKLTIISAMLLALGYFIMISMYEGLKNNDVKGNYGVFFLCVFLLYCILSSVAGSATMSVMNINKIFKDFKNKDLPQDTKKAYKAMLVMNVIILIGVIIAFIVWGSYANS